MTADFELIQFDNFLKLRLIAGTILHAGPNTVARIPAYTLAIEFGDAIDRKTCSARITHHYSPDDLIGRHIACVKSEVLAMGLPDVVGHGVLLEPEQNIPNFSRVA